MSTSGPNGNHNDCMPGWLFFGDIGVWRRLSRHLAGLLELQRYGWSLRVENAGLACLHI